MRCPIPFVHRYIGPVEAGAQAAGNIGNYLTGQNQFHNQLSANADQRAQDSQNFQFDHANDQLDLGYAQLDAQNQRYGAGLQNKLDLNQITQQDKIDLEELKQGYQDNRLTEKGLQTLQQLDQKFQNAQKLQQPKLDLGYYKNDSNLDEKYYGDEQKAGTDQQRMDLQRQKLQQDADWQAKRIELEQAKIEARSNPNAYRAAASHAADLVRMAAQRSSAALRQLQAIQFQLSSLPPVGKFAVAQRAQLQQQMQQAQQALIQAQQEQQGAMTEADQLRQGAAGGGQQQGDYGGETANPAAVQQPQGMPPQGSPMNGQGPGTSNGIYVASQITQQVLQQMPGASREAIRMEIKSRLLRQGIDPVSLGIN